MVTEGPHALTSLLATALQGDADAALERWAACGAMWLTGDRDGQPLASPAPVALAADVLAAVIAQLTFDLGRPVVVDGAALLGERAALTGLGRQGSTSCGGACRLLEVRDAWIALSLARDSDLALIDAWLRTDAGVAESVPASDETWSAIAGHTLDRSGRDLVEQASLLGLPCALEGEVTPRRPLISIEGIDQALPSTRALDTMRVVDLSALWAGPLCGHLFGLAGADVIKVESANRPDGSRSGSADFFDLLHAGHRSVAIDFTTDAGRATLIALIETADIVIESSRPRALDALGASFEHLHAGGWRGLWLSITGYGSEPDSSNRVGFGDDAAVAGGLVARVGDRPVFVADAIADPLTGMLGAAAVLGALSTGVTGRLGVSLAGTAAHIVAGLQGRQPVRADESVTVVRPTARNASGVAAVMGAHTDEVVQAL
ncbi:MAG: acyl-CoA transferase [Ilumatobacteraceae bacterium]|nr:acyl-CoA transferase [Ilumatobacteraceae bacterium]